MVIRQSRPEDASKLDPWADAGSTSDTERVWDQHSSDQSQHPTLGNTGTPGDWDTVPDLLRPGRAPGGQAYMQDDLNPWVDGNPGPKRELPDSGESRTGAGDVPQALQPGVSRSETNPFKKKPVPARNTQSQNIPPALAVPANTAEVPPSRALAQISLNEPEPSSNPWTPPVEYSSSSATPARAPSATDQESIKNVWASGALSKQPTGSNSPASIPMQVTGGSTPWDDDEPSKASFPPLPRKSPEQAEFLQDQHAWDDVSSNSKGKEPATVAPTTEGWNLIDFESQPEGKPKTLSRQSTWENFADPDDNEPKEPQHLMDAAASPVEIPPKLPPRTNTAETAPPQPPRPQAKSETYQIKNINWLDSKSKTTRKSPILVQNVNGPCPLVALVNALTLTTPPTTTSNLVETLRSREQVSISFLLEAVFDELMSGRRDHDADLPDMTELYGFLKGLQTGMNVNPRFVPSEEAAKQYKRSSLGHVHPFERESTIPGTFEDTRDMKLYSTFSIPLMHGWLPSSDDPVCDAFRRQSSSYDDIQSLLFGEEELEDKLTNSTEGLTEPEQQLYQDILTIKSWLSTTATQLTPWGLEVVTKSIQPGGVAILFRNDHFATLYRHPQTLELLTLVTDAGYHTHDEVIWESLVDVRGERSEFYSGDFRLVGGPQGQQHGAGAGGANSQSRNPQNGGEWQTVQSRRGRNNQQANSPAAPPPSSQHEQEDRDLALALQLQEEEEERHRNEQAARRRQSQLSEQYIEQQGRPAPGGPRGRMNGPPQIPPRGSGPTTGSTGNTARGLRPAQSQAQPVRSLVPPRTHRPTDDNEDDAPPTYEQASKATPYTPPTGHPSHPGSGSGTPRRTSAAPEQSRAGPSASISSGLRGRQTSVSMAPVKDEKCVVM